MHRKQIRNMPPLDELPSSVTPLPAWYTKAKLSIYLSTLEQCITPARRVKTISERNEWLRLALTSPTIPTLVVSSIAGMTVLYVSPQLCARASRMALQ